MSDGITATTDATERILVRSVNWLGDAVMSTPALQRLREAKPRAHIALLAHEKIAAIWEGQAFIDEVLVFRPGDSIWRTARRLRTKKYSTGLAFPNSVRSALQLWLAGIPRRIGYERPWRNFLLTDALPQRSKSVRMVKHSVRRIRALAQVGANPPPVPAAAHHVHNYLGLVAALGASPEPMAPRLEVGKEEIAGIAERFGIGPTTEGPLFGLNPGAEYGPAKRWPAERFVAAALALQKKTQCRWVIFGNNADGELADWIAAELELAGISSLNLAGRTTLRELMAAIKSCQLILSNDSGPMHLAAALGTPVVAIFGSTSPEMTAPSFSKNAQFVKASGIPCSPCFLRECPIDFRCMTQLEIGTVVDAGLRAYRDGGK